MTPASRTDEATEPGPADRLLLRGWRSGLVLLAVWAGPLAVAVTGHYLARPATAVAEPLQRVLLARGWFFLLFACVCPFLYRIVVRWPLTRWPSGAISHAAGAAVVTVAALALGGVMRVWLVADGTTVTSSVAAMLTTRAGALQAAFPLFWYLTSMVALALVRSSRLRRHEERRAAALSLRASRLESQVATARLRTLEMQLNPHFLFNALNSVGAMVQCGRNDDAYRAIELLGELLRETIDGGRGDRALATVDREIAFLERYLELERIRFSDRLTTASEIEPGCEEATVPALILQPLVENAIRHSLGVRARECRVEIGVRRRGRSLELEVRDDGPGPPAGWTLEGSPGTGLRIVRERLAALFGEAAELRVEARQAGGTVARVMLPFEVEAAAAGTVPS